jgi:hypothetical protein
MTAQLRMPLLSLSADNFIARGSGGQAFAISQHAVFKCPTLFDNPVPAQAEEMKESIKRLENEKAMSGQDRVDMRKAEGCCIDGTT